MKFVSVVALTLVFGNILRSHKAIIIVKWHHIKLHFERMREGYTGTDGLSDFELPSRQVLCDFVLNAPQFLGTRYGVGAVPLNGRIIEWSPGNDLQIINYQRYIPTLMEDPDPAILKYKPQEVLSNYRKKIIVNMFPCMILSGFTWYITYGFAEKFMYLIEPIDGILMVTALIELSAELDEFEPLEKLHINFKNQVTTNKDFMESVCDLEAIDHLRLCGLAYEILILKEYLPPNIGSVNYVQLDAGCQQKIVVTFGNSIPQLKVRPCKINNESIPQFYVLADIEEVGSIFILFPTESKKLVKLTARVKQVGALLYPTTL